MTVMGINLLTVTLNPWMTLDFHEIDHKREIIKYFFRTKFTDTLLLLKC